MALTGNHLQNIVTDATNVTQVEGKQSYANVGLGEIILGVNSAKQKIFFKTSGNTTAEFGNNGADIPIGSAITYDGETFAPASSSITQTLQALYEGVIETEYVHATSLNQMNQRVENLENLIIIDDEYV